MSFVREGTARVRVPIVSDPCRIGRDLACEVVVDDARVAPVHARVRYVKGEYVLAGDGAAVVWVNGKRAPLFALRSGDHVLLTPPRDPEPVSLRWQSRIEGSFRPPGTTVGAAWLGHPRFAQATEGPARYAGGTDPDGGAPVEVRTLAPLPSVEAVDRWLLTLEALAGAPHPALPAVVDGGVVPGPTGDAPLAWVAVRREEGTPVAERRRGGALLPREALRAAHAAALAVAHLLRRGLRHGALDAEHVLLRRDGTAALVGVEAIAPRGEGEPRGVDDVLALATLAREWLGADAPETVATALLPALDADPLRRPSAATLARALAFGEAALLADGPA